MDFPFLISDFFVSFVWPFVFVFALVFAVLQKTKVLGDESQRVNAIIALVMGMILISFPYPRDIIVNLMPFLAVTLAVLFVFMLVYGFYIGKKDGDVLGKGWKVAIGIVFTIIFVIFLIKITGYWDFISGYLFNSSSGGFLITNGIIIAIIIGVIVAVLRGEKSG